MEINGQPLVVLPPVNIYLQKISFSEEEKEKYSRLESLVRLRVAQWEEEDAVVRIFCSIFILSGLSFFDILYGLMLFVSGFLAFLLLVDDQLLKHSLSASPSPPMLQPLRSRKGGRGHCEHAGRDR
jgi:hypothetical protein